MHEQGTPDGTAALGWCLVAGQASYNHEGVTLVRESQQRQPELHGRRIPIKKNAG